MHDCGEAGIFTPGQLDKNQRQLRHGPRPSGLAPAPLSSGGPEAGVMDTGGWDAPVSQLCRAVLPFWDCAGQLYPASTQWALSPSGTGQGDTCVKEGRHVDAPPVTSPATGPLAPAGSALAVSYLVPACL